MLSLLARCYSVRGNTGATPQRHPPECPTSRVGAENPATTESLSLRESPGISGLWIQEDYESGGQEFESLRARQIRRKVNPLRRVSGNSSTRTRSVPVSCPEVQPHPIALWGEQTTRHFLYFDDDRNPDLGSDRGVKVGLDLRRLNSNDQRITSDFFPRAKMRTLIPPAHRWIDGDVPS